MKMRQWFKSRVWGVYTWEYNALHNDGNPSPQISLCRLSWSLVGLSVAILALSVIWVVILFVANLLVVPITWFWGFSPNYKWAFFQEDQAPFLHSEGSYHDKTYYKLNKRFAPWEIGVPLILVAGVAFGIQQGLFALLLSTMQEYGLITAGVIVGTITAIALIVAFVLGILHIAGNARCPVPLDFSDIVKEQAEESVSA